MGRPKRTRKERAQAAKLAAKREPQSPVKRDFWTDRGARFSAYLWAVFLTVGYGLVNDLIFGRPERRVDEEAVAVCAATLLFYLFLYYRKPIRAQFWDRVARPVWAMAERLEHWKYSRNAGLAVFFAVLIMAVTPIGTVEPAIAARRLEKSNIGLVPGLDSGLQGTEPAYRFREVSSRIGKLIQSRKPGDIESLTEARDSLMRIVENVRLTQDVAQAAKLELAYLQSYQSLSQIGAEDPRLLSQISSTVTPGMPVVIGAGADKTTLILVPPAQEFTITGSHPKFFSDFGVVSFGHSPGAPVPQFAVTNGDNTSTIFNNILVQGLAQDIGNLTWTNVVFQGCLIRYHGQPLRMGNVTFTDCTFERSKDGSGRELLDYLSKHQGEPVSAFVPSKRR